MFQKRTIEDNGHSSLRTECPSYQYPTNTTTATTTTTTTRTTWLSRHHKGKPFYTVNQKKTWQYIFDYNFG